MDIDLLMNPEFIIIAELALVMALFLFFVMSRNFTYGIYLWLLSAMFFEYQKLNIAHSILPDISAGRILFMFLIGFFIIQILTRKCRLFPLTKIEYSMFSMCLLIIISMVWSGFIVKEGGRLNMGGFLSGYVFPFSMFFISKHVYDSERKRDSFFKFVILIGFYLSFTAVFEHFGIRRFIWPRYIFYPDIGIHFGRARGPFVQAAVNGTVLCLTFSAVFYFLFNAVRNDFWKFCSSVLFIAAPIAVFFTYTRAPWISAFLSFVIIATFNLRKSRGIFIAIAIILCVVMLSGTSFIADGQTADFALERMGDKGPIDVRMGLYKITSVIFLQHPLFGVGFGRFTDYAYGPLVTIHDVDFGGSRFIQHDTFASILTEMGLVGLTLMLSVYFFILSKSIGLYRRLKAGNPRLKNTVVIFWAFTVIYIFNSVFIEMRNAELCNSLFFIFAGIICRLEECYREKNNEAACDRAVSA